jgi:hypothetical protein
MERRGRKRLKYNGNKTQADEGQTPLKMKKVCTSIESQGMQSVVVLEREKEEMEGKDEKKKQK